MPTEQINIPPVFSVVIPCYNHGHFIEEALESVSLHANSVPHEVIIINDGSTDPFTQQKLQELEVKGYLVRHQDNQGLGPARNHGLEIAKGKYILILDSDNKLAPGFVDKALAVMERQPQVGVVYGDMQYFGKQDTYKKVPMYDKLRILSGNYIDACSLIRAKVFEEVGTYDIQRVVGAYTDWELWIRIGKSSWEFHYTDSLAFFYRISENSMIDAIKDNYEKHLSAFNYIVNKHFDSYSYLIHEFSPIREKMKALELENYRLKSIRKNPFTAWRRLLDIWK